MLNYNQNTEVTAREVREHEWEVDMFQRQSEHQIKIKELDIQAAKLEAKITSWFRIPLYIIGLPVRILFVLPLCIYVARGQEVPEDFWKLVR